MGDLPLEGEQRVDERVDERLSATEPEPTDQIDHPGTVNSGIRQIGTENPPINVKDPEPSEGRGKHIW